MIPQNEYLFKQFCGSSKEVTVLDILNDSLQDCIESTILFSH